MVNLEISRRRPAQASRMSWSCMRNDLGTYSRLKPVLGSRRKSLKWERRGWCCCCCCCTYQCHGWDRQHTCNFRRCLRTCVKPQSTPSSPLRGSIVQARRHRTSRVLHQGSANLVKPHQRLVPERCTHSSQAVYLEGSDTAAERHAIGTVKYISRIKDMRYYWWRCLPESGVQSLLRSFGLLLCYSAISRTLALLRRRGLVFVVLARSYPPNSVNVVV